MSSQVHGLDRFYPIVPDLAWLQRLVPLGIRTVQLRLKDAPPERVRQEMLDSLEVCRRHGCQLIVNDYWREALEAGADYLHLGQEDLAAADLAAIHARGIRLGISTHSLPELDIALAA
ncbi:MAG TPA: thiamine phosphate synthase, partial [Hyphomicrobiaceae bacterium]|nr:thiamine phosphate synthase [Hyphomicrobiaceae bacterium]